MLMTQNKVKIYCRFPINIDLYTEKPVEVFVDQFIFDPIPEGSLRIVILEEPLDGEITDMVRRFPDYYDYVLTYRDDILSHNARAVYFRGADIWSRGYDSGEKRFAVSTVVGGKYDRRMLGYEIRHEVWHSQDRITIPKEFYLSDSNKWKGIDYSKYTTLYGSKDKMFDCQFHIAIENTSINNYYSEKLLDCIETLTVPIYYGCKNVGNFFNIDGVLIARNSQDIVNLCNSLDESTYAKMLPALQDNQSRIKGLPNYDTQLKNTLIELLKTI